MKKRSKIANTPRIYPVMSLFLIIILLLSGQKIISETCALKILTTTTTKRDYCFHHRRCSNTHGSQHFSPTTTCHKYKELLMMRRQKVTKGLNSLEMIPKSNSFSDKSNNVSDDNGKLYPLNYRDTQLSSSSSSSRTTNFYSWIKDPKNQSVFGVLASSFLSLLGFTMVSGPLTPALGKHFQLEVILKRTRKKRKREKTAYIYSVRKTY